MDLSEYLKQLETRAGQIMSELRAIDDGQIDRETEHDLNDFDNTDWLSSELEEMGTEYDEIAEWIEENEEDGLE